jgi:hypothetical protein
MKMCSINLRKRWKLSQLRNNNNNVHKGCHSDYVVNISWRNGIKVHDGRRRLFNESL